MSEVARWHVHDSLALPSLIVAVVATMRGSSATVTAQVGGREPSAIQGR